MKISTMENITFFVKDKDYVIEINENEILNDNEKELECFKKESPYYFILNSSKKENNKYILNFTINEGFKPILDAKKYSEVIRLSLLDRLLRIDPLTNFDETVLIHPQNIFFNNTNTLKFLYRNNSNSKNLRNIDQYKLFIFSFLSKYSYEQYKFKKVKLLEKEKNEFFFSIDNADSVKELHELISKKLYKDETQYFLTIGEQNKNSTKTKYKLTAGITALILITLLTSYTVSKNKIDNVQTAYSNKLTNANKQVEAYKNIAQGDSVTGIKLLKDTGATKKQLGNAYFITGKFDDAIANDSSYAKKIIDKFYTQNKPTKILKLNSNNKYVKNEQTIIKYNYMSLLKVTLDNKEQLKRLALSFVEHQAFTDALDINDKIKDKDIVLAISNKQREIAIINKSPKIVNK